MTVAAKLHRAILALTVPLSTPSSARTGSWLSSSAPARLPLPTRLAQACPRTRSSFVGPALRSSASSRSSRESLSRPAGQHHQRPRRRILSRCQPRSPPRWTWRLRYHQVARGARRSYRLWRAFHTGGADAKKGKKTASTTKVVLTGRKENVEEPRSVFRPKLRGSLTRPPSPSRSLRRCTALHRPGRKVRHPSQDTYAVRINFPNANAQSGVSTPTEGADDKPAGGRSSQKPDEVIIKGGKKGVEGAKAELLELLDYEKEHNNVSTLTVSTKSVARIMGKGVLPSSRFVMRARLRSMSTVRTTRRMAPPPSRSEVPRRPSPLLARRSKPSLPRWTPKRSTRSPLHPSTTVS